MGMANPSGTTYKIYLIAGEPSGDVLGARLMEGFNKFLRSISSFTALADKKWPHRGSQASFPCRTSRLWEFLKFCQNYRGFVSRLNKTVKDVVARQPDIIVTIDSPGFSLRVAKS